MKKHTLFLISIFISISLISQTPQAFKYQAVVRDNVGEIIANQAVGFRISIHNETPNGTIVYQEVHDVTTSEFGLVNLEIGNGDPPITGFIKDIDWGTNEKFMEVELDLEGGNSYISLGTTQLLAVPYSLYAESTGDTSRWRKNVDDLYYLNGKVGIGTTDPNYNLDIYASSMGQSRIRLTNSDNSKILLFGSGNDLYNSSITFKDGDALRFMRYNGGYSELMRIRSDGNIGIGTSIPAEKLSVLGNIELRVEGYDPYIRLNSDDGADGTTEYIWSEDAKGLAFGNTHGSPQVLIENLTGNVGIGTSSPDGSAVLELKSNERGFLPPRLTAVQIASITDPANGLMVYNTDDEKIYVYVSGESLWKELSYGTATVTPYKIGSGESCNATVVNGTYKVGVTLDGTNTVNIDINVLAISDWSITTNTVNGYSFSGSGIFTSTGVNTVTLVGSGIPINPQIDSFTATADVTGGLSTCTFDVTVIFVCGNVFVDNRDGQTYNTVHIGTQCWMAENINYNSGYSTSICYDNQLSNCTVYGRLYTEPGSVVACPTGWHLASSAEWCILENEVDAVGVDCSSGGWQGTDVGSNLKEAGPTHWGALNTGATNSSGFTALPGGFYYGETIASGYYELGTNGYWWSGGSSVIILQDDQVQIAHSFFQTFLDAHSSVRCIKDE